MNAAKGVIRTLLRKQKKQVITMEIKSPEFDAISVGILDTYVVIVRRESQVRPHPKTSPRTRLNAEQDDVWIADSGATDHVTHRKEWFSALKFFEVPIKVHIGNKSTMDALGKGIIHFEALVNGC
jgi:hypothetical protein